MSHGPEHHMEHAEHAIHAAGDDFNRKVTMSIAIVAAVLACVTMLGHRAHNDTLRLQGESLALQTQASIKNTKVANQWNRYQTKNMFNLESEITLDLLKVLATRADSKKEYDEIVERYESTVEYYSGDKNNRVTAESKEKVKARTGEAEKGKKKKKVETKSQLLDEFDEARKLEKEAEETLKQSKEKIEESHLVHEKANRFDYGELGLQFGVVLCSLAILTKSRGFWFAGLASSVVGALVSLSGQLGLFIGGHH